MIEKLNVASIQIESDNNAKLELSNKINELVDTVNELQENLTISKMENVDPYTEQRKWVGKVCWFWDDDNTNASCGILTSIDTETFKEPQFVCNDEYDYEHCEPVKPDDEIIFKGGKDEL